LERRGACGGIALKTQSSFTLVKMPENGKMAGLCRAYGALEY